MHKEYMILLGAIITSKQHTIRTLCWDARNTHTGLAQILLIFDKEYNNVVWC